MKMFKALIAGTLAAILILASSVAVLAQNPSAVTGTGTILAPIISVTLPAAPAVRINPFLIANLPEISSPTLVVANRSNVNVHVAMRVGPHAIGGEVTFRENDTWPDGNTDRVVHMEIEFATGNAPVLTNGANANALRDAEWTFPAAGDDHIESIYEAVATVGTGANLVGSGGHVYHLVLGPAAISIAANGNISVDNSANMTNYQTAAFRFTGDLNPEATGWAANQVSARMVFTVTPLVPAQVEADSDFMEALAELHATVNNVYTDAP